MSLDWRPPHQHTKHWNKSLQRRLFVFRVLTGEDLRGVPGGHGYSRSAREPQPAGDRCGKTPRNVDIVESRRNGPQLSMRHDDHDVPAYVNHYSDIRLITSGLGAIAESCDFIECNINMAVLGHGKSLCLRSHKSCGHGDWWNVKSSVCTYVGHYSDIRLITSGFGAIAVIRNSIQCKIQFLIRWY